MLFSSNLMIIVSKTLRMRDETGAKHRDGFLDQEGSLSATTVVLVVVTRFRKMPKALLIHNGKLRNFAYTFVTSFPTDLPKIMRLLGLSANCCKLQLHF